MADTLYLSLWYPNLRLTGLGEKLTAVLTQFAAHGGEARVYAATVWPINWNEPPVFQRIYGKGENGAQIEQAMEEGLEMLHDDYAYEFQIAWNLWEVETGTADAPSGRTADPSTSLSLREGFAQDDSSDDGGLALVPAELAHEGTAAGGWAKQPRLVRVTGYGPLFDEGAYEQDGHIRIDFGSDGAFLLENEELSPQAAKRVEENVRQLVELAAAIEKASGATARILWSELGESLAQRLAARLGGTN
jgi:hypothetical protein